VQAELLFEAIQLLINVNAMTKKRIIMPVKPTHNHWALVVIDPVARTITYMDSLLALGKLGMDEVFYNVTR
jgi:Ulp1 family protease